MKKTAKRKPRREARTEDVRSRARLLKADQQVDYRDYEFLRKFMTERGKILPARLTGANAQQQRQVKRAIRRVRVMGLLP
ncbi:MAG: 30S ribosomal protein S18 [Kiritimatiellia bacterium]|jgi:small subunit ribosomal protein S18|nr:30S ribosomal protein S18 [Lentisphaerota bacterium]